MDEELEKALYRLQESEDVESQTEAEIMRFWNEKVKNDDSQVNRSIRKLIYEHLYKEENPTSSLL